jgi:hypothetical protein
MPVKLTALLNRLSPTEQQAVAARAAVLIAEEMAVRTLREAKETPNHKD